MSGYPAPQSLRQAMAWIHGWLGLLAGWLLFAMFLTGTASYFRPEITRWMQPELMLPNVAPAQAAEAAVAHLQKIAPGAEQWYIYLPDERTPATRVFVRDKPSTAPSAKPPKRAELRLHPLTGEELVARDTRGGEHFYRFHFQLQLPHPWGRWLAGLCAIAMLTAIISGVITHKRIFTDFFTLRWKKGQRSWLDAHNVSAVIALPFHAMITYTGLITLVVMYMPWPIAANYKEPAQFQAEAYGAEPSGEATGLAVPLTQIVPIIRAASDEWGGALPTTIVVRHPNDAAATIQVARSGRDTLSARNGSVFFSGVNGRRLSATPPPSPAIQTTSVMLGLHMGLFAGPFLRTVYFLLGLSGAAMVGTGLVLWTAKRRRTDGKTFVGLSLAERLNIAAIACLPAGMAAFFLANRLLPPSLADRAAIEVSTMFWMWLGLAALACLRPPRRAWIETLSVAAATFALIPLASALTTERGLLAALRSGDTLFIVFDGAMLAIAAALAFTAVRVGSKEVRTAPLDRAASRPSHVEESYADAA